MSDHRDIVEIVETQYLNPDRYNRRSPNANGLLADGWRLLDVCSTPGYEYDGCRTAAFTYYVLGRPTTVEPWKSPQVEG